MKTVAKVAGAVALAAMIVIAVLSLKVTFFPQTPQETIMIAVIPEDGAVSMADQYARFVGYLEGELGVDIEMLTVPDYSAVVEALKYDHVDIAYLGPFAYILATAETDVDAVVAGVKAGETQPGYKAFILSRPGLTDLNGATFAFVDPGSTSGYLIPNTYVIEEGIELGNVMFAGSHPGVIEAIKNGSVDAGAVADNRFYYALEEGVVEEGEIEIFWESDLIPGSPWVVQGDMDPAFRQALVDTMLAMPEDVVVSALLKDVRFAPVSDADYNFIRKVWELNQ